MASLRAHLILILYFTVTNSYTSAYKVLNTSNYELCQEKLCVPKCCPDGYIAKYNKMCVHYPNKSLDFSELQVYDVEVTKQVSKEEILLIPDMFKNETFKTAAINTDSLFNLYLTEGGFIYLESPNSFLRWVKSDRSQFCVDYILKRHKDPVLKTWIFFEDYKEPNTYNALSTYAKMISSIFLLLVLIIYPSVPANRDINGITLMLVILNLFLVFILLYVMSINTMLPESCLGYTFSIYFFYIANFCWINVMAFNTWRTWRCYEKVQLSRRTKSIRKMAIYNIYAWGLPLIMTIFVAIVNSLDLRESMPWFIKPNVPKYGCFIEGGHKMLYLFLPSLILLLVSIIFYVMSARNIFRFKQWTAQKPGSGETVQFQTDYQWFKVQVAMVTVMIIHCLLELVGSLTTDVTFSYISDIYGMLWGPLLFFILIIYFHILRRRLPANSDPSTYQT